MLFGLVVEVGVVREGVEGAGDRRGDVVVGFDPVELVSLVELDVEPGPQKQEQFHDVTRVGAVVGNRERPRRLRDVDHVPFAESGKAGGRLEKQAVDAVGRGRADVLDQGVVRSDGERLVVALVGRNAWCVCGVKGDVEHAPLFGTQQARRRLTPDATVAGDLLGAQYSLDCLDLLEGDVRGQQSVPRCPRRVARQNEPAERQNSGGEYRYCPPHVPVTGMEESARSALSGDA